MLAKVLLRESAIAFWMRHRIHSKEAGSPFSLEQSGDPVARAAHEIVGQIAIVVVGIGIGQDVVAIGDADPVVGGLPPCDSRRYPNCAGKRRTPAHSD